MFQTELAHFLELFQLPFMQRALIGGILTGIMGGILGSFTILRQLSFFSDALGHSALLGISLGYLLGLNPSFVLLPFVVILALLVSYLLEHTRLWTDALLNIISSSAMAIAIITLSFVGQYKGGLDNLLFGDILAIQTMDLVLSGLLLSVSILYIGLTFRTQMLLTVDESLAIARGVPVSTHHMVFIVLLSLVVGISIKGIGVLLVSAFVVIPACAAQQLSRTFNHYVLLSVGLGVLSAVGGMVISAWFNLPSGPSIVATQLVIFLTAMVLPHLHSPTHKPDTPQSQD
ncbi:MAG: metal ABC transporter permease [Coleofasciculaceae cyanobacterium]